VLDSRLRYAVAVARVGSFSGASKAVGVTQSAITKSVADLEQQLGFAIFNRTSRGVAMTPEGRDFIDPNLVSGHAVTQVPQHIQPGLLYN